MSVVNPPLSDLFNQSFDKGYSYDLTTARVYNDGSVSFEGNKRPISLKTSINEIFEKIIFYRRMSFLKKIKILFDQNNLALMH